MQPLESRRRRTRGRVGAAEIPEENRDQAGFGDGGRGGVQVEGGSPERGAAKGFSKTRADPSHW